MSAAVTFRHGARFKIGRIILLVAATLVTLNHAVLLFVLDEPVLFLGYTAYNLYALLVIAMPFQARERWAWYGTWILPVGLGATAALVDDPAIVPFYAVVAVVCGLGLLLTMQDILAVKRQVALH